MPHLIHYSQAGQWFQGRPTWLAQLHSTDKEVLAESSTEAMDLCKQAAHSARAASQKAHLHSQRFLQQGREMQVHVNCTAVTQVQMSRLHPLSGHSKQQIFKPLFKNALTHRNPLMLEVCGNVRGWRLCKAGLMPDGAQYALCFQTQREHLSLGDPLIPQLDIVSPQGEAMPCYHNSSAVSSGGVILLGQQGLLLPTSILTILCLPQVSGVSDMWDFQWVWE